MRHILITLSIFVVFAVPLMAQNEAPADYDPNEIIVKIDGEQLDIQDVYELERDQTYKLEVENLKPGTEVEVVVKFMGLFGVKKEKETVPEKGKYWRLFDTPRRRGGANAMITYVTKDGQTRTKDFKLKVR